MQCNELCSLGNLVLANCPPSPVGFEAHAILYIAPDTLLQVYELAQVCLHPPGPAPLAIAWTWRSSRDAAHKWGKLA